MKKAGEILVTLDRKSPVFEHAVDIFSEWSDNSDDFTVGAAVGYFKFFSFKHASEFLGRLEMRLKDTVRA